MPFSSKWSSRWSTYESRRSVWSCRSELKRWELPRIHVKRVFSTFEDDLSNRTRVMSKILLKKEKVKVTVQLNIPKFQKSVNWSMPRQNFNFSNNNSELLGVKLTRQRSFHKMSFKVQYRQTITKKYLVKIFPANIWNIKDKITFLYLHGWIKA